MGHYAELKGKFGIAPALREEHRQELLRFARTQYAPWRLSDDSRQLLPPLEGTRQPYEKVLQILIDTYLAPWGYQANGEVRWEGEEPGDTGTLRVAQTLLEIEADEEEPLGKEYFEQILSLLRSRCPEAIREAADMMNGFGEPVPGSLEVLISLLNDPVMEVRWQAATCLAVLEKEAAPAVPFLIVALKDTHEWVRVAAAETLGYIGSKAAEAVPALKQLCNDSSYGPRGRAQEALEQIQGSVKN